MVLKPGVLHLKTSHASSASMHNALEQCAKSQDITPGRDVSLPHTYLPHWTYSPLTPLSTNT
eukprot:9725274-Ditylum_brightwellii.AAC.1